MDLPIDFVVISRTVKKKIQRKTRRLLNSGIKIVRGFLYFSYVLLQIVFSGLKEKSILVRVSLFREYSY